MRRFESFAVLLVLVLSLFALMAAPAMAAPSPLLLDQGEGGSGDHKVNGLCAAVLGVSTNLNQLTYAVNGRASAQLAVGHVPVGTSIACAIRNKANKVEYGRVSGGAPGPFAVAVGRINVPTTVTLIMCTYAETLYPDTHRASYKSPASACQ